MLEGRERSHCRTCALAAIVSRLKNTSGGLRRAREETVQLVVWQCNWKNPNRVLVVQDSADPSEGVPGPRPAAGCVRESRVRSGASGEPVDGEG